MAIDEKNKIAIMVTTTVTGFRNAALVKFIFSSINLI
jgi:hypothetical protein